MNDKLSVPRGTHLLINFCYAQIKVHNEMKEMAFKRLDEKETNTHARAIDTIIRTMLKGISFNAGQAIRKARY